MDSGGTGGGESGHGTGTTAGGTDEEPPSGPIYEDVTVQLGVDAPHEATNSLFIPTGQAWVDLDNDGLLDLVVTRPTLPNLLYRNTGAGLMEIPNAVVGLPEHPSGAVTPADIDHDGWIDLLITGEYAANVLLRNLGGWEFADVTAQAGLGDPGPSTTASFGDYDGDGWADLYVPNNNFEAPDRLYRNRGDGTFEDTSDLLALDKRLRLGLAAAFFDFDEDGDTDLYILNDKHTGNLLWRNDGPGCGGWCFTDVSAQTGAGVEMFAMGLAPGDYDRDGDIDLFLTNIGDHVLLQSQLRQGSATYVDVTAEAGVKVDDDGWGEVGWGCAFVDYDNDGFLDLYVTIGNYESQPSRGNRLFHNRGDGTFEDVSKDSGANVFGVVFGLAPGDFDGDGFVDFALGTVSEGYSVLRNRGVYGASNHWLSIELRGAGPVHRDAFGSRVVVTTSQGVELHRVLVSGATWGGDLGHHLHFGLHDASITDVEVVWPNGQVESLGSVSVDSHIVHTYPNP